MGSSTPPGQQEPDHEIAGRAQQDCGHEGREVRERRVIRVQNGGEDGIGEGSFVRIAVGGRLRGGSAGGVGDDSPLEWIGFTGPQRVEQETQTHLHTEMSLDKHICRIYRYISMSCKLQEDWYIRYTVNNEPGRNRVLS